MMAAVVSGTKIERLHEGQLAALRAFLRDHAGATVFHSPAWHEVIRSAYGHACDYWVAWSGDDVCGVFPVVRVRAPLMGSKMVAIGYQMDSGLPLADSPDVARALVERAAAEARSAGVRYLEVRALTEAPELEDLGFVAVPSGLVTTVASLAGMELSRIRRNHRRGIRSAEEQGLTITESRSLEDLRTFQRLYLAEGRSIGAPQAGWRFFESLHRHGAAMARVYLAKLEARAVGGMITLGDERVVYARNSAYSSPQALVVHAGTALYWRAISDAAAGGDARFNCGISWEADTGLIHWKEGWAAHTVPVRLYVLPVRSRAPSPGAYLGGFRLAKAAWRRLPLPIAELGGHMVTRWVC